MIMTYDKDFILGLAHGDAGANSQLAKLPTSMKMSIAVEVDRVRKEQNIVPQSAGFSIYEEKAVEDRDAAVAETIKRMVEQKRRVEEEARERNEELVKKQVEQAIQRSRLGLPAHKNMKRLG